MPPPKRLNPPSSKPKTVVLRWGQALSTPFYREGLVYELNPVPSTPFYRTLPVVAVRLAVSHSIERYTHGHLKAKKKLAASMIVIHSQTVVLRASRVVLYIKN